MTGKSAAKRLKKMASEIPDDRTILHIFQILDDEQNAFTDHSIALIGASVVDKALEIAIRSRWTLNKDDPDENDIFRYDQQGPLASLSAKIKIAKALDIFGPKTKKDLDHIRAIRNAFAHSLNLIRFDTPEVASICDLLHTPSTVTILGQTVSSNTPRAQFINAVTAIARKMKYSIGKAKVETIVTPNGVFHQRILQ